MSTPKDTPTATHEPCEMGTFCLGPATKPGHICLCRQVRAETATMLAAIRGERS